MSRLPNWDSARERPTLVEILRARAQANPSRIAYTWTEADGSETELTFGALEDRVRSLAAMLQHEGARGERVLLLFPHGLDYIVSFLACLYANAVPVPAYPPDGERLHRSLPRLAPLTVDASPKIALASPNVVAKADAIASLLPSMASARWLTARAALAPEEWRDEGRSRDDVAFLQYTSGSTSDAKGVVVTHGNLLENSECIRRRFATGEDTVSVSWLPIFHDMGLIMGVLHTVFNGHPSHLMSPLTFLQRPLGWLEAISKRRATVSGAPNFAYDLCVQTTKPEERAALDLRSWKLAFSGAEPVRAETVRRFTAAFAPSGFDARALSPCYGLAEVTLMASGHDCGAAPEWIVDGDVEALKRGRFESARPGASSRALVSTGHVVDGHRLVIVDPETHRPKADCEIGEIWLSGESVAKGYWGRPEKSVEVFGARLESGEGPFLRTGDLGFLRNRELFISGRLKDLVIVRGLNHAPTDIEHTAEKAHKTLRVGCVAAFAIEGSPETGDEGEELVIVQDVKDDLEAAAAESVTSAIRERVVAEHGIDPYAIVLTRKGGVPKTSSGKIRRGPCRDAFLRGELPAVFTWRRPAAAPVASAASEGVIAESSAARGATSDAEERIRTWLIAEVSRRAGVSADSVDLRRPFAAYGLASRDAVALSGDLGRLLGRHVPPTIAYEHATIEAMARHLAGGDEGTRARGARVFENAAVAIVGMACRFPDAADPEAYWRLLVEGHDAVSGSLDGRFAQLGVAGGVPIGTPKRAALLAEVRDFDAAFFGIAPREAVALDPQQRMLLELSWEALEHAAIAPNDLEGTRTGVFVGISGSDFSAWGLGAGDPRRLDAYVGTGAATSVAAGRIAYTLGLRGPALAVDTACSSSLVALHLAVESLRRGESDLALAGAAQLILRAEASTALARMGALSQSGACHTFDAKADGYVRGEGGGVVVLKRLRDAQRDGNRILAVVRGSAINHDGRSNGLTSPSGEAQRLVIGDALADAHVSARDVHYVEAHGTGTPLGDPIEIGALSAVYGAGRDGQAPLLVGSVKTNLGHLEAAAGMASLLKVVLSLGHGVVPPHRNLRTPNPAIDWASALIQVPMSATPWPEGARRLAGVSAFGFSGTNAHVLVEGPPAFPLAVSARDESPRPCVLTVSAQTPDALRVAAQRLAGAVAAGANVEDVCFTANVGRSHLAHRAAVVACGHEELASRLGALAGASPVPGVLRGEVNPSRAPSIAFLFSGQGSQYSRMGVELFETEPVFRSAIERCARTLDPLLGQSLVRLLQDATEGCLDETAVTQPALFAIEYALAEQWRAWGVEPKLVLGHSVGEIVAATIAGVLTLDDALAFVAARGRLMRERTRRGAMVSAFAGEEQVRELLVHEPLVSIAAINGADTVVISGDEAAVLRVAARLEAVDVPTKRLTVSHAFHSPLLDPMLEELERVASGMSFGAPRLPLVSNVSGRLAGDEVRSASYWREHARQPVRFADGARILAERGIDIALEIGPQPVLLSLARRAVAGHGERQPAWIASLRKGTPARDAMLAALAALHVAGVRVDWRAVHAAAPCRPIALPTYPFQRTRLWPEPPPARVASRARRLRSPVLRHSEVFEWELGGDDAPFAEHKIYDRVLVPGAGHVALCATAVSALGGAVGATLEELTFPTGLFLSPDRATTVQVCIEGSDAAREVRVVAAPGDGAGEWTVHAAGRALAAAPIDGHASHTPIAATLRQAGAVERSGADFYEWMTARGFDLGPTYRWIERVLGTDREALAELRMPRASDDAAGLLVHPGLVDSMFQALGATLASSAMDGTAYVPLSIDKVTVTAPPASQRLWVHARARQSSGNGADGVVGDLTVFDDDGRIIADISGLFVKRAAQAVLLKAASAEKLDARLHEVTWVEEVLPDGAPDANRGAWVILADSQGVGEALGDVLEAAGESCVRVARGPEFAVIDDAGVILDPESPDDYHRMLDFLGGRPVAGIVDLLALDASAADDDDVAQLEAAHRFVVGGATYLVQALVARELATRVVFVTRGARATRPGEDVDVAQAPLWALGRVVALEHSELRPTLIDLDQADPIASADAIVEEIGLDAPRAAVARRGANRFVPRIAPAPLTTVPSVLPISAEATYLVTGGTGALGLHVARRLVERGARHLVLLARRPAEGAAQARIAELEALGAHVALKLGSVDDPDVVASAISLTKGELPPLRGVVHAAGVLDDSSVAEFSWERAGAVLAPKAFGAWNLHRATQETPLDFFVLFSSASSLVGVPGQAAYGAANAFLDALAHHRRAQGLTATSIQWGPWAEAGLGAGLSLAHQRAWEARGIESFAPEAGLELFERCLAEGRTQVAAIAVSWATYVGSNPEDARDPLFTLVRPARGAAAKEESSRAREQFVAAFARASRAERSALLEEAIRTEAASVLGLSGKEHVPTNLPLGELGLDSMMGLELAKRIGALVGKRLAPTVLFNHPSPSLLARHLASTERDVLTPVSAPAPRQMVPEKVAGDSAARIAEVRGLSEEELAALALKELDALTALTE